MTEHLLKLNHKYYDAVANGIKTFEIRENDRDYRVGDTLILRRCDDNGECPRHGDFELGMNVYDEITTYISYILTHEDFLEGVPDGYIAMSIKVMK